jgi:hypothetical protein
MSLADATERAWAVLDDIGRSPASSGRLGLQPG